MTIPQIVEQLARLESNIAELHGTINEQIDDIRSLRQQLGIESPKPSPLVAEPRNAYSR